MIKLVTIIGARPQIIKAAALSRAISCNYSTKVKEIIVHTGQHYDTNMSDVFFNELNIPKPHYNLGVGSGKHGETTAKMIVGIEDILLNEQPHYLILYGDTNSTVAGGIAASKLHIPVVHIEAGLRSFNKRMPEEINRILCDHVSSLLFCPTQTSINNLKKEGFNIQQQKADCNLPAVYHCGDIMYDNSLYFSQKAQTKSNIIQQLELTSGRFVLVTIHRDYNTDNPQRLTSIFQALLTIANQFNTPIILPIHPRTKKILPSSLPPELYDNILNNYFIKMIPPAGYLDMIALETNSSIIITDSGGVQKEAYFFKKPCLIIRSETEWVELLETNSAILCDADTQLIIQGYQKFIESPPTYFPPIFGSGQTAQFIIEKLLEHADISSGHN